MFNPPGVLDGPRETATALVRHLQRIGISSICRSDRHQMPCQFFSSRLPPCSCASCAFSVSSSSLWAQKHHSQRLQTPPKCLPPLRGQLIQVRSGAYFWSHILTPHIDDTESRRKDMSSRPENPGLGKRITHTRSGPSLNLFFDAERARPNTGEPAPNFPLPGEGGPSGPFPWYLASHNGPFPTGYPRKYILFRNSHMVTTLQRIATPMDHTIRRFRRRSGQCCLRVVTHLRDRTCRLPDRRRS
jgi:hypothetical protein